MNRGTGPGPGRGSFADDFDALPVRIGEILLRRSRNGGFELCHRDDVAAENLVDYASPEAAREIARYDDSGEYRPLKTAPNLRHGWRLLLRDRREVRLILDFIYPGRLAALVAHDNGALLTTPLRETLGRQSGMYKVAARIADEQADALVSQFCRSEGGCLRTILWKRDTAGAPASSLLPATKFDPKYDQTGRDEEVMPLLCQEACNLLVAAAAKVVKSAAG